MHLGGRGLLGVKGVNRGRWGGRLFSGVHGSWRVMAIKFDRVVARERTERVEACPLAQFSCCTRAVPSV
jgi:hypothetical protein